MRYEKGRKDASRRKIMEVASERFRCDGIAATGLATIMSDAGMTNGVFTPVSNQLRQPSANSSRPHCTSAFKIGTALEGSKVYPGNKKRWPALCVPN